MSFTGSLIYCNVLYFLTIKIPMFSDFFKKQYVLEGRCIQLIWCVFTARKLRGTLKYFYNYSYLMMGLCGQNMVHT